ncbi:MAG: P27 family phage terminase small subunit [Undibacterium sp.]|nr:P27 family phage terminase small subunit [Opitutaceae bacterium]
MLKRLAADLTKRGVSGCSLQMLERMCQFYATYPQLADSISSSPMRISREAPPTLEISSSAMTKSKKSQSLTGLSPDTRRTSDPWDLVIADDQIAPHRKIVIGDEEI